MPSYPFTIRKRYEHKVVVISDSDPEIGFVLDFPNEQKARHFMYAAKQAKNSVIVEYERKEIHKTDEGWIL